LNLDLLLFKLFLSKNLYLKYSKILDMDFYRNNSRELFKIFTVLSRLHGDIEGDVTLEAFLLGYFTDYPAIKEDERAYVSDFVDAVSKADYDEGQAMELLQKHHEKTVASQIAIEALNVSQGKGSMDTVKSLLDSIDSVESIEASDVRIVSDDLNELLQDVQGDSGLRWRLETMNKSLGSLRVGDFGFLYARPETGKTTFLSSEAMYMAEQAKEKGLGPVLWFNNEEKGSKVKIRNFQSAFKATTKEIYNEPEKYRQMFLDQFGGMVKLIDEPRITPKMVEKLCEEYKPSLILFDQLDKIIWGESERNDLKLKAIYQWAREIAKMYAPFIAVCQAGGSADGKKYLDMNDVDSSTTAKQGEADFMFGIGKTFNENEESQRFISISKNKLLGDADSLEDMRHAKVPVIIHPTVARYEDLVRF
jgi:hypothetical protein